MTRTTTFVALAVATVLMTALLILRIPDPPLAPNSATTGPAGLGAADAARADWEAQYGSDRETYLLVGGLVAAALLGGAAVTRAR